MPSRKSGLWQHFQVLSSFTFINRMLTNILETHSFDRTIIVHKLILCTLRANNRGDHKDRQFLFENLLVSLLVSNEINNIMYFLSLRSISEVSKRFFLKNSCANLESPTIYNLSRGYLLVSPDFYRTLQILFCFLKKIVSGHVYQQGYC